MDVHTAYTSGQARLLTKSEITSNVQDVQQRVQRAASKGGESGRPVRLVAVSKLQPVECLRAAYDAGVRTFGENYVQEFLEKSVRLPNDTQWHFIGHVPLERAEYLAQAVPNLAAIESVDSIGLAELLNSGARTAWERQQRTGPLRVFVQVNTTGQRGHPGIWPGEPLRSLVRFIRSSCPALQFAGLMTIGGTGAEHHDEPADQQAVQDWESLFQSRKTMAQELGLNEQDIEMSFGMSCDFESAIVHGSSNVRVGLAIFGERGHKNITEKDPNQVEAELREH